MNQLARLLAEASADASEVSLGFSTDRGDVLTFTHPGGFAAIKLWRRLRQLVPETKHWPVILGTPDDLTRHVESVEDGNPVRETLDYSTTLDGASLLATRAQRRLEELRELNPGEDEDGLEPDVGEWPADAIPHEELITHTTCRRASRSSGCASGSCRR